MKASSNVIDYSLATGERWPPADLSLGHFRHGLASLLRGNGWTVHLIASHVSASNVELPYIWQVLKSDVNRRGLHGPEYEVGSVALMQCQENSDIHQVRLIRRMPEPWWQRNTEGVTVGSFATAYATIVALNAGYRTICTENDPMQPEAEATVLQRLGYRSSGAHPQDLVLDQETFMAGLHTWGKTHLEQFLRVHAQVMAERLQWDMPIPARQSAGQ